MIINANWWCILIVLTTSIYHGWYILWEHFLQGVNKWSGDFFGLYQTLWDFRNSFRTSRDSHRLFRVLLSRTRSCSRRREQRRRTSLESLKCLKISCSPLDILLLRIICEWLYSYQHKALAIFLTHSASLCQYVYHRNRHFSSNFTLLTYVMLIANQNIVEF